MREVEGRGRREERSRGEERGIKGREVERRSEASHGST